MKKAEMNMKNCEQNETKTFNIPIECRCWTKISVQARNIEEAITAIKEAGGLYYYLGLNDIKIEDLEPMMNTVDISGDTNNGKTVQEIVEHLKENWTEDVTEGLE